MIKNLKRINKALIKQFLKFALTGTIGTLIHISLLYILTEYFSIYYIISSVIAFMIGNLTVFYINKTWTFNEDIKHKTINRYFKYFTISIIALILNISLLYAFTEYLKFYYIFSQLLATCFSLWVNFIGNKVWTFKD